MEVGQFSLSVELYVYIYTRLGMTGSVTVMTTMHYGDDHYMLRLILCVQDHVTKHNFQSSSL